MDGRLTVRFSETQGYDINEDCDVAEFMATTGTGSFWARVLVDNPKILSTARKRFKERTLEAMQKHETPREINVEVQD